MDPLTIMLFGLAVLWLIRRGAEDVVSIATGRESPRVTRLRMRRAERRLTVAEAVGVRLARLIAQGRDPSRPRGPLRVYVSELWADSWEDARRGHEARRRSRLASRPSVDPQPSTTAGGADDTEVIDAEVIDTYDHWEGLDKHQPEPPLAEPPGPDPAQEPTRKEPPPMPTQSTVIVPGEAASPVQALAWADGRHDTNRSVMDQLQYLMTFLRGKKLGPSAIALVGAVYTAVDSATGAIGGAQSVFAEHVLSQQDLTSDPVLRDTLVGYLAGSRS